MGARTGKLTGPVSRAAAKHTTVMSLFRVAEVYQNGQEGKKVAAQEVGLPSDVVKPSVGVGDSLNLALGLS